MLLFARSLTAAAALLVLCTWGAANAQISSTSNPLDNVSLPFTPSLQARSALHLLADEAKLPLAVGHWPQPANAVREAMAIVPRLDTPALLAARDLVLKELDIFEGAELRVQLRNKAETLGQFGDTAIPGSSASVRSPRYGNDIFALQAGLQVDERPSQANAAFQSKRKISLTGSAAAVRILGWNLQASATPRWWGVGWQASLVQSHNAPAMLALGVQRSEVRPPQDRWLSWIGPWSFEGFIGQMEYHQRPEDPLLLAARFSFRPTPRWEVGLTKSTQTAGKGRPSGLKDLARAFLSIGGNQDNPQSRGLTDSGNTLGGFDVRYRCPEGLRCSFYTQLQGEDEAGNLPSKYLTLWGTEWWNASGSQRFFAEYSDSHCNGIPGATVIKPCAYLNGNYASGFTHTNRWLGASQGPDSRILSLGWIDTPSAQALRLSAGKIGRQIGNFSANAPQAGVGDVWSLSWQKDWPLSKNISLTPELAYTRLQNAGPSFKDWRAGLSLRMALK
jgi:Capsule assembly protein Wzi